jgi:CBS domain-containing protein
MISHALSPGANLLTVPAVAIDTETTGLDPRNARIIELAAVRIHRGHIVKDETFSCLINPGIAVPEDSRRIHGIDTEGLADALGFGEAGRSFAAFVGQRLIIGYAVGFDLAILEKEFSRVGHAWPAPRALDLRQLVRIALPEFAEHSLEGLAARLGIAVTDRHRALPDAKLAARIYLRLVPLLRKRHIRLLGEAETACRRLTPRVAEEAAAGWHALTPPPPLDPALLRIDSYPYRHVAADIMASPPVMVTPSQSLREVLAAFAENRISSVFVRPDGPETGWGIITERDLLRAIAADPKGAFDRSAADIASFPLKTVQASDFVYRAISRMNRWQFRHLGVADEDGNIVGALSARDLLRQRAQDAVALGDAIEEARTARALGEAWSRLTLVAEALVREEVDVRDIAAVISGELRDLTRRAAKIAEDEFRAAGRGGPPCPYCYLVLGSGGRGESLLALDQDNAIVFAEGEPGGEEDRWFAALAERVSAILDAAGVPLCVGGVMASKDAWRMSLNHWRQRVGSWMGRLDPEDLLKADIFFDAVPVHGDLALGRTLLEESRHAAGKAPEFIKFLALRASSFQSPLGWFGRLRSHEGRVDLKLGGLMPLFSTARVLALQNGLSERPTPARFDAARDRGALTPELTSTLIGAHRILLEAILAQQLRDIRRGVPLSNRVAPGELQTEQRDRLRWALRQVPDVANALGDPLA